MRETTQNFLVGLTSIIAIIGIAFLLMQFGELDQFVKQRYVLTIHTDHAAGLRQGSSAEYNGVPIGFVNKIALSSNPQYPVQIEVLAFDRKELIKDISTILAADTISVTDINSVLDQKTEQMRLQLTIRIRDYTQLSELLAKISTLTNVQPAKRLS